MAKNPQSSTANKTSGDGPASRNRSPNHPAVDLERAIELTDKLYRTYRNDAAVVSLVHSLWEYNEHSSVANQMVAALRAFGLIDTGGAGMKRSVNVSEAGERIVRSAPDSEKLIKAAALSPAIYREVWDKYNGDLPHDDILRQYLVWDRENGNFNEEVVGGVIDRLRSTFSFAKISQDSIIEEDDSPEPDPEDENDDKPRIDLPMPPTDAIPLPVLEADGSIRTVIMPRLSAQAFAFFKKLLDQYEPAIVRAPNPKTEGDDDDSEN